jgi:hypothetical protein
MGSKNLRFWQIMPLYDNMYEFEIDCLILTITCTFILSQSLTLSTFADFSIESMRSSKLSVSVSLSRFLFLFSSLEVPLPLVPLMKVAKGKVNLYLACICFGIR